MAEAYGMRHAVAIANRASRRGAIESTYGRPKGWYVRPALGASRTTAVGLVGLLLLAGCGGERGDENEPSGDFEVEVVKATFPEKQKLAQSSNLVITVRNAGDETIPNLGVTVEGFDYRRTTTPAWPTARARCSRSTACRSQIGGFPEAKDGSPRGCDTAYVNTWACGPLAPGREKTFRWSVTAVRAGDFDVRWRVFAGLHGKARAVQAGGGDEPPSGSFSGTISRRAPQARIADDGETVITED